MGSSSASERLVETWEIIVACLIFLFFSLLVSVNPYDLLGWLLGGIAVFYLLDGLLRDELRAVTFSHEFFEMRFPSKAIIRIVPMCRMEGTILSGIPLVQFSF